MQLGVNTHFQQGFSQSLIAKLGALGASTIRDGENWAQSELARGVHTQTALQQSFMTKTEAAGVDQLLVFNTSNPIYGSGMPATAAARQAYADHIVATLQLNGGRIEQIEIFNEINSGTLGLAAGSDKLKLYAELLKTVYETVKPVFPDVQILGGSVCTVAVGTLEKLFKLGALDHMDGVVVHPYAQSVESLDEAMLHLKDVMARYGAVKPIHATEFGFETDNPAEVPDYLMKAVTLMASAGVAEADWYGLSDEPWFRNMGLYDMQGNAKPGAAAFTFIANTLLTQGDPVKVDTGDDVTRVYRYGQDTYVIWGADRGISIGAGGSVFNSKGEAIAAPTSIGDSPIIVRGAAYTLSAPTIVADSYLEFGAGDWEYYARTPNGRLTEAKQRDWEWTSYLTAADPHTLVIRDKAIAPAGSGANPIQVVERYVSPVSQQLSVTGTWKAGSASTDGVDLHILLNGREILTKIFTGEFVLSGLNVALEKGDTLDFALGPNQSMMGDTTARRIQLVALPEQVSAAAAPQDQEREQAEVIAPITLIEGTSGNDMLTGGARDETFRGGAGDDRINAEAGDDLLVGGSGRNMLDGGDGIDTVSYAESGARVIIDLKQHDYRAVSDATVDAIRNVENVVGSRFDDVLRGTAGHNRLEGGDGNDSFMTRGGDDVLIGGAGDDTLSYASSSAAITLSLAVTARQDSGAGLVQLSGIENLTGGNGADRLIGDAGDDLLEGGAGDDTLKGGAGNDTASYADAATGVTVDLAAGRQTAGGRDVLTGIENLLGSALADTLGGNSAANRLDGGAGNDVLTGAAGSDTLTGGAGADRFVFLATTDSKVSGFDRITDFSRAQGDRIDLSAIDANSRMKGDQAFVLVDTFTKQAGQLDAAATDDGYVVQGDVNGDGKADFAILVAGVTGLGVSDFLL